MERSAFALSMLMPCAASALQCPEMPRQATRDAEVEVRVGVRGIGDARGADLETRTRALTTELLSRLPRADRVYLEQMLFAAYCSAVRDNPALAQGEREARVAAYVREMRRALTAPPPAAAKAVPDARALARAELERLPVPYTLEAFMDAVRRDNRRAVQLFITAGFDVNQRPDRSLGALYIALSRGYHEMALLLLNGGALPDGASLAHMVWRNDPDGLRLLLARKPSPAAVGYGFQSAIASGNLLAAKLMLEHGASVAVHGPEAVWRAANADADDPGIADTLAFLRAQGIDIDAPDAEGWTPLMSAASRNRPHATRALLSLGADVNRRCVCSGVYGGGMTPLLLALQRSGGETARMLLDAGADTRAVTANGRTALHLLARHGTRDTGLAPLLIERGATIDTTDNEGMTPLMLAVGRETALTRLLITRGARVDLRNADGAIPLSIAAGYGNEASIAALLDAGAAIDGLTVNRRTALAVAVRNSETDSVRLLLQRGARTDIADENGMTPLDHAQALSDSAKPAIVRLLQGAGAR